MAWLIDYVEAEVPELTNAPPLSSAAQIPLKRWFFNRTHIADGDGGESEFVDVEQTDSDVNFVAEEQLGDGDEVVEQTSYHAHGHNTPEGLLNRPWRKGEFAPHLDEVIDLPRARSRWGRPCAVVYSLNPCHTSLYVTPYWDFVGKEEGTKYS